MSACTCVVDVVHTQKNDGRWVAARGVMMIWQGVKYRFGVATAVVRTSPFVSGTGITPPAGLAWAPPAATATYTFRENASAGSGGLRPAGPEFECGAPLFLRAKCAC